MMRGLIALLVVAAAAAGLFSLLFHARLFALRMSFPLDLEWMEGGVMVHAYRLAQGKPIYLPPSIDFIPFLYPPLYPALLALLGRVFPLGYTLGRAVSVVGLACACGVLTVAAKGEVAAGRGRWSAWLLGLWGAGAVVAAFAFTGTFYDLVRADSLALALDAIALWFALRGTGWKSAVAAGAIISLAFFAKQTASIMGVGIGVGLLIANWRRGVVYGLAAAAAAGSGIALLTATTHGWFWTYIFGLHQSHAFNWHWAFVNGGGRLWAHGWPIVVSLVVSTVGLGLLRKLQRTDAILWTVALAGIVAALVGFGTQWAYLNAFIPGVYFPVFAATLFAARLVAAASMASKPMLWLGMVAVAFAGWQNVHASRPGPTQVPTTQDRTVATELLSELKELPAPMFIPSHPYYGVLAGKDPFLHSMGLADINAAFAEAVRVDQAIQEQRFGTIVLDEEPQRTGWPSLEKRYSVARRLVNGFNSVRMFTGYVTQPRLVMLRNRLSSSN